MEKREFGVLIREARAGKSLSLRRLAGLSGVEYSRLARIEQGTRPAPDLMAIRSLADVLDLDLGELLVAAGTARSVMEDLVWSERVRLARALPDLGRYRPEAPRLRARNTFVGRVVRRRGAVCSAQVGNVLLRVLSLSHASRLRLVVPPETVIVSTTRPSAKRAAAATVLAARVQKARRVGQLANLVLALDGLTLNALYAVDRADSLPRPGDSVFVTLLTAAISTQPLEEEA